MGMLLFKVLAAVCMLPFVLAALGFCMLVGMVAVKTIQVVLW